MAEQPATQAARTEPAAPERAAARARTTPTQSADGARRAEVGDGAGRVIPASGGRRVTPASGARRLKPAPERARATRAASGSSASADATGGSPRVDRGPSSAKGAGTGSAAIDELLKVLGEVATQLFGSDSEERAVQAIAFLRRRLTGDYDVDPFGFDEELTETALLPLLRLLYRYWFRVEVRGTENIPAQGAALVVANHSGTIPLDSLMTQVAVHDAHPARRHLRMLGADLVFQLPFVADLARKSGTTLACNEDVERLLGAGELVGVWPEGFKGIGKPFAERYKLQRFGRGGFVAAAIRSGAPIIPCAIVGAEETYPLIGNLGGLARLLGLPYVPVTPTFPWLGPLGLVPLPSKWIIEFGEPIPTDVHPAGAADDPMLVFDLTDRIRETIQQTLYSLLVRRRSTFF
jgi:1-acyl-sn-glycerol-3-phosphate acyltransferase